MSKNERPRTVASSARPEDERRDEIAALSLKLLPEDLEPLTDDDLAMLKRHAISAAWAEKSGFRRVSSEVAARLLGVEDTGKLSGIFIPYFFPGETEPYSFRIRADHGGEYIQ